MSLMRGVDFQAMLKYIDSAAQMKSKFIEEYWILMQKALSNERQKLDKKGKPMFDKDENPLMEENPIQNQLQAVFMLASYSKQFANVPNAFIEILVKQTRYIQELEEMRNKKGQHVMPYSLARAKATTRKYIALVVKTLAVDLTKFSAPALGFFEEMAKSQESTSIFEKNTTSEPKWKNR